MIVSVALTDPYHNSRTIELDITTDGKISMTGSKAIAEAVRIANENNPPKRWPVGVPCGPWAFDSERGFKRVAA